MLFRSATVGPASPLPASLTEPVCSGAPAVTVTSTRAGTVLVLRVEKRAPGTGEILGTAIIGRHVAHGPVSENVPLAPGWGSVPELGNEPGNLFLLVQQQGCSWAAPETGIPVSALPASVTPPRIVDGYACTARVRVDGLTPGAFVEISTDRTDLLELAPQQRVYTTTQTLQLYRTLHPGEVLRVAQRGCGADALSAPYTVTELDAPPVDVVDPVRMPHKAASFKNLVVGARLHITVDERTVMSLDVTDPEMRVPLPMLEARREQRVAATQELCGKTSDPSNVVQVTRGRLALAQIPRPVTRGNSETVTVRATDADTGTPVTGSVRMAGVPVATTGTPFVVTVPAAGQMPHTTVEATGYDSAELVWGVRERPAPTPPPSAAVHVSVTSEVGNLTVTGVTWTFSRRWPDGSWATLAELDGDRKSTRLNSSHWE